MKYYLVAGEASGDLHGSNLMNAIKAKDSSAEFRFIGGDFMEAQGGFLVKHYREMAFMGFVEVLRNIRTVLATLKMCKEDIERNRPDVLVLIDFPGFNLKIAAFAKSLGIKVCYYISPKVWAWNQKRVHIIKRVIDKMFVILPFEVDFYKKYNYQVTYVGNPLMDAITAYSFDLNFKDNHQLSDKPIIAILPGSRKMELQKILPEMLKVVDYFPNYQFIIAGAPGLSKTFYQQFNVEQKATLIFGKTYDILKHAEAAIVTSGTATLETALFRVPQVVCYKANYFSVAIAKLLVKIRFISLVNLIMNKHVVKELIQEKCNEQTIKEELTAIVKDQQYRSEMLMNYKLLIEKIGSAGASLKAAEEIVKFVS